LPARALSIRFQPNSPSALASGEEAKIGLLATALKAFSSGKLLVTGYCAAVGDKAGDGALTRRAPTQWPSGFERPASRLA
jgi:outer membrane protein OmpA-like peptidoglycan-associated protein